MKNGVMLNPRPSPNPPKVLSYTSQLTRHQGVASLQQCVSHGAGILQNLQGILSEHRGAGLQSVTTASVTVPCLDPQQPQPPSWHSTSSS